MSTRSRQRRIAAIEQARHDSAIADFSSVLWNFRLNGTMRDRLQLVRILLWGVPRIDREDTTDLTRSRRARARLTRLRRIRWRYHLWRILCYTVLLALLLFASIGVHSRFPFFIL